MTISDDLLMSLGLTGEAMAMIEAMADEEAEAKAAAKPGKGKARKPLLSEAMVKAEAGELPDLPAFPVSNYYAQRHAIALREAAEAGNAGVVAGYTIGGTNTYSKALRRFRDALLRYLEVKAGEPDTSDIPEASEEVMASGKTVSFAEKMKAAKAAKKAAQNATGAAA